MSIREDVLVRRAWFVPGLVVYGSPADESCGFLTLERLDGEATIGYSAAPEATGVQTVAFDSLTDHRGNQLPAVIDAPRVILRPRSASSVFLVREESDEEFAVARDPEATGPVTVDLLIMEMGA